MIRRLVLFMAILWIAGFADAKNLHWNDLPRYLKDKQVTIADGKGMNYSGRFVSTKPEAIVIDNGHTVEIPRGSIVEITRYASRTSTAEPFFSFMVDFVTASPGPLVIITFSLAVVVSIAGLPVCALLNFVERRDWKDVTIKLLPDPK
jgi:hypothetical protein